MKIQYQQIHNEMLADIAQCMQLDLPESERAESCFWIAYNYWEKLKQLMSGKEFASDEEEIDFFRNVKPQFTLYIEYFIILSEALLSVRNNYRQENEIPFWKEEMKRFERFKKKNQEFVRYYESECHDNDHKYFLRKNCSDLRYVLTAPVYDIEEEFCTGYDQQVRSYLAHKKFYEYSKERLEKLIEING